MKNSIEIRQERATAIEKANDLLNLAKNESRDFTNDEQVSYDGMMTNIDKMAKDIEVIERQEKLNAEVASNPVSFETQKVSDSKEVRDYSFIEAAKAATSGRVSGLIKEMDQEARSENRNQEFKGVAIPYSVLESRAAVNTALTAGSNPTNVLSFVEQLSNSSILIEAGANFYSGVSADQKIPVIAGVTTGFYTEAGDDGSAATLGGTVTGSTLSPNVAISGVEVSAASMVQNSSVETAFRNSIAKSIMSKLENQLLSAANIAGGPASFFADATAGGTTSDASALTDLAAAQAALFGAGVEMNANVAVLMNPNAYADLMGVAGADFTPGYLNMVDRRVATMPYFVSSNVGNNAGALQALARVLVLDMDSVHMALFGGLDMLVDPYTNATFGGTRLITTALVDGLAVQPTRRVKIVEAS
tara:strand:- start:1357 stop:2610 length:1254 start_codon:yes stop_codon:yes gene_type:complete